MTDRTLPERPPPLPDEPPPDAYDWTNEPEDPDAAGMPGEFVNDTEDGGVPGVGGRRSLSTIGRIIDFRARSATVPR